MGATNPMARGSRITQSTLVLAVHENIACSRQLEKELRDAEFFFLARGARIAVDDPLAHLGLLRRFWDRVIVAQPTTQLLALALAIPAAKREIIDGGALRPWSAVTALRGMLQRTLGYIEGQPGFGNDYSFIVPQAPAELDSFPTLSFVVPVYNRIAYLEKTLAGIARLDYPPGRIEVIVADDGSSDSPESLRPRFEEFFDVSFVRQEDRGYRLAEVRNLGIEAASGDIVVSLDCDMIPAPELARAYARWFCATEASLLVVGDRKFIRGEGVEAAQILEDPTVLKHLPRDDAHLEARSRFDARRDWRHDVYALSGQLRFHAHPYAIASGGNVAFRREEGRKAGGYDPEFRAWGGEDQDFAFRMARRGAYVIPERRALAYHQYHSVSGVRADARDRETLSILGGRVPYYRRHCRGKIVRPEVSVYIPVYRGEETIGEAIESVLSQGFKDLEVCVFNDGSDDDTGAVLDRIAAGKARVRVEHGTVNRGIAAASKRAVEMCRGEFVMQLDCDDVLLPDAVRRLLLVLRRDPMASLAYGGYRRLDLRTGEEELRVGEAFSWERALLGNITSHPRMFRSTAYYRSPGFDSELTSAVDYAFYLELAALGRVIHVPEILYEYRWHGSNVTLARRHEQLANHRAIAARWVERVNPDWTLVEGGEQSEAGYRIVDAEGVEVERSLLQRAALRLRDFLYGAD